jgi:class 3 adenylate cyclase
VGRSGIVSVLFVDLVGFTSRSDRADPEDVRDALRLYHAEAKQRIELAADRTTTVLSGLPAAPSPAE